MNDFLLTVFKGMYPLYFCLLVPGVIFRIRCRKWGTFDSLLLFSFLLFEFLAAWQVSFFYGILSTSKRYLWIGLPLGLPFAANGLLWLSEHSTIKKISPLLGIILIGINIYNVYSPVMHEKHSISKTEERTISREAAAWIVNDWKNCHTTLPVTIFKCDQYQSGKRPLVQSEWMRIGWLSGGQNYPEFFISRNVMPDYIVSRFPVTKSDYVPVKGINQVTIYKKRNIRL